MLQYCQPCSFPVNLDLFFVDFLKTCGLLVLIKICLFFGLVFCRFQFCALFFFLNFMAFLLFQFIAKFNLGMFSCKFAYFGLVFFRICFPAFIFNLHAGFMFFEFSYQMQVGLVFSTELLILGLFFKFACLFHKITWHHCYVCHWVILCHMNQKNWKSQPTISDFLQIS